MSDVSLLDRIVHDLRGPLVPLQTATYLLGRDDLPPERRRELLDTLERQSRRLGLMIEEAGDWVRASQQRLVSRREPCELGLLVDTAIGGIAGCRAQPRIAVELAAQSIPGDETRLLQMLTALLRHACARDPESTPAVVVASLRDRVRITISDQGPTPAAAELSDLFEQPCAQPADSGLGLRLLIAHTIARDHGGSLVAVAGEADPGMSLVCELPLG